VKTANNGPKSPSPKYQRLEATNNIFTVFVISIYLKLLPTAPFIIPLQLTAPHKQVKGSAFSSRKLA
jgi:hypothetical protein